MSPENANFFFYFNSTIAQVIAAIVGLAGVFVTFYIPTLNNSTMKWLENLIGQNTGTTDNELNNLRIKIKGLILSNDIKSIEFYLEDYLNNKYVKKRLEEGNSISENMIRYSGNCKFQLSKRRLVLKKFKRTFIFGSIVILLSLISIFFPSIPSIHINVLIAGVNFFLVVATLSFLYRLIVSTF